MLPTTPPTTVEVETFDPEPERVPFPEAAVLEVVAPELTAVPPAAPPKASVDVDGKDVVVNALEEEEDGKVVDDSWDEVRELEEGVRCVSEVLDEEELEERVEECDDEFAKLCDELLEL